MDEHQNNTMKNGFSLLEVIIAIFVIVIGIVGAVNLISYSISSVAIAKSQVIATNLTQEGVELVRGIRDSNWIEDVAWNTGLGDNDYRVQHNNRDLLIFADTPLKIDANGYYQYDSGNNTHFYRKITIANISAHEIKIVSEVTWSERGRSLNVIAENRLYDWK